MNPSRRPRLLIPIAAIALFVVALVAPATNAANIPPLVTSAQYKALVQYVDKLDGLSHTPATSAQKADYESQLSNKRGAAANKAAALFKRGKKAAQAESNRSVKAGVQAIRRMEASELAALRNTYDERMNRAATEHAATVGRLEDAYDSRSASLSKQIRNLRKQKANAQDPLRKVQIQEAIERRIKRGDENRKAEQKELSDLQAGYRREKAEIRSAKSTATLTVQQNDDEAVETLRTRSKRIYNTKVRTLQNRRVNQLNDLANKLNAGRAAIARMPLSE